MKILGLNYDSIQRRLDSPGDFLLFPDLVVPKMLLSLFLFFIIIFSTTYSVAEETNERSIKPHILYNDDTRTLNYDFFPITYYLNLAFDTVQEPKAFNQYQYLRKHSKMLTQVTHPIRTIRRSGGVRKLITNELFGVPGLPNWSLHLVGGAYDFRMLAEYYDYQGFFLPYMFAFITAYATRLGNEAVEETPNRLYAIDHLADFYFFDFLACFLFLSDSITKFFYNDLQMRAWYGQPVMDLKSLQINNASGSYVFRPYVFGKKVRPFIIMGMHYLFGVSINTTGNDYLSIASGVAVVNPFRHGGTLNDTMHQTKLAVGIYYDRNNALMWSLIFHGTQDYLVRLNVYPPAIKIEDMDIGLFFAINGKKRPVFGMNINMPFGFGWHI